MSGFSASPEALQEPSLHSLDCGQLMAVGGAADGQAASGLENQRSPGGGGRETLTQLSPCRTALDPNMQVAPPIGLGSWCPSRTGRQQPGAPGSPPSSCGPLPHPTLWEGDQAPGGQGHFQPLHGLPKAHYLPVFSIPHLILKFFSSAQELSISSPLTKY